MCKKWKAEGKIDRRRGVGLRSRQEKWMNNRWRLRCSPADHNESNKLELPRAWEPSDSLGPLPNGEGKEA